MKVANIGKNIAELRKTKNKTAEQLAEALNVSRQTISKWENGETVPNAYNVLDMSTYLDVSITDIYGQIMADKVIKDAKKERGNSKEERIRELFDNAPFSKPDAEKDIKNAIVAYDRGFLPFSVTVGINFISYEEILRRFNTGYVLGYREYDYPVIVQDLKARGFLFPAISNYLRENGILVINDSSLSFSIEARLTIVLNNERELLRFKELMKIFFVGMIDFDDHEWLRDLYRGMVSPIHNMKEKRFNISFYDSDDMDIDEDENEGIRDTIATVDTEDEVRMILDKISSLDKKIIEELSVEFCHLDAVCVFDNSDKTMRIFSIS